MEENFVNNSGQGKGTDIPAEVKRFNWGAFFFSWIWGVCNKSYLTLIALAVAFLSFIITFGIALYAGLSYYSNFVSFLLVVMVLINVISVLAAFVLAIWFGVKGNNWAWQNKKWKSLEHFHFVQRIWAIIGAVLFSSVVCLISFMTISALNVNINAEKNNMAILKTVSYIENVSSTNAVLEKKCELSSNGIAEYFNKVMRKPINRNKIEDNYSSAVMEFVGDGACVHNGDCYIIVSSGTNKEKIRLYLNKKRLLEVNPTDTDRIIYKYKPIK